MGQAIIVTDLGYGDAGKGSIVDYLARQAGSTLVVRYNGGPQAAHNVITPEGQHHTFAQLGSASFVGGLTHLSRFMLVNPFNLTAEIEAFESLGVRGLWERLTIDEEALVITPWHVAANRIREIVRGNGRHGSCGQGIGEVKLDSIHFPEDALRIKDLSSPSAVRRKLIWLQNLKRIQLYQELTMLGENELAARERAILESAELIGVCVEFYTDFLRQARIVTGGDLAIMMDRAEQTIFEGAQGVLLDENYGFHPYTTWSVTTQENARLLLEEIGYKGPVKTLGLLRAYMTRHGAGPFVTEDATMTAAIPDYHNTNNNWQKGFRVGHLDFVALRYALQANKGADELVVTNLDRLNEIKQWQTVGEYQLPELHRQSPYFTGVTDGLAQGIKLGPRNRRDYQEAITRVLLETSPVLTPFEPVGDTRQYLELIESELGVPVRYTSQGPTALEKQHL